MMEMSIPLHCEVKYNLLGFGDISNSYTHKEFERLYDSIKGYNTDLSHEIYEGAAIDKDGLAISVVITIINLDK